MMEVPWPLTLGICFAPGYFSSLNSAEFLGPALRRLDLLDRTCFICRVARDADVVVAFENQLNVAEFEGRRLAEPRHAASTCDNLIDKVVCDLEKSLRA